MATLTIRNLDPAVKETLRVSAALHGHSMEAEARLILQAALQAHSKRGANLAEAVRRRFAPFGGIDHLEAHPAVALDEPTGFEA